MLILQSVRLLAVAILTGCVAVTACLDRARAADADRFPMPDRPVASVISPAYSSEELRDRHGEAERVLNRLGIHRGMRVADIGAGEGYYTVRLARRLGEAATIYAEDIDGEYLQRLESRLRREGISHVHVIRGKPRDPELPRAAVDVAILAHMYHEIENPYEFLYRLWGSLDAGARVAVVDVDKRTENHGTPPALLRCEMAAVGFRQVDFTGLAPADGYLAVFVPPDALPSISTMRPCWHSGPHGAYPGDSGLAELHQGKLFPVDSTVPLQLHVRSRTRHRRRRSLGRDVRSARVRSTGRYPCARR